MLNSCLRPKLLDPVSHGQVGVARRIIGSLLDHDLETPRGPVVFQAGDVPKALLDARQLLGREQGRGLRLQERRRAGESRQTAQDAPYRRRLHSIGSRRDGAGHLNLSSQVVHVLLNDGKPESGSPLLGREEGLKDLVPDAGRDPRTMVAHRDEDIPFGFHACRQQRSPPGSEAWIALSTRFRKICLTISGSLRSSLN